MGFEAAHEAFVKWHSERRTGERRGRLERGHRHGEILFLRNVWYPVMQGFESLHPEFEVPDWRGRSYFADFAWLKGGVKLIIEIKGYAKHVRDMDRQGYCNENNRETFLKAMGFGVISFAYDDVEQRPDLCITLLRMVLSQYQPSMAPASRAILVEKEVIRLAIQRVQPLRPVDVANHLKVNHKTAVRMLMKLCEKGWLRPSPRGKGERVVRYEFVHSAIHYFQFH